jgi:hypothetical protein
MHDEKTNDAQAREDAFRSLNYATYFAASDGNISCCGTGFDGQYWFDDGYADYSRNFSWGMGAIPEFARGGREPFVTLFVRCAESCLRRALNSVSDNRPSGRGSAPAPFQTDPGHGWWRCIGSA